MKIATIVTQNNGGTCSVYTSDNEVLFVGPTHQARSVATEAGYYVKAEMTRETYDLNVKIAKESIAELFDLGVLR